MICDCIEIINGVLAKYGASRIDAPIMMDSDANPPTMKSDRVAIVVGFQGQKKRGERKVTVVACFCPFCGQAYDPETKYTGKPVVTLA